MRHCGILSSGFLPTHPRPAASKGYRAVDPAGFRAHSWLMENEAGLGRIGKAYRRDAASAEALQRFERNLTEPQAKELGAQLAGALILVLLVLGVIGWAFTL